MNISEDIHRAVVEGDWSSIHAWLVQTQRDVNAPVDDHGTTLLMLVAEWANNRDDYVEGGAFRPGRSGSYAKSAIGATALAYGIFFSAISCDDRPRRIVCALLRAGASLDACYGTQSADELLSARPEDDPRLKALVADVRKAGSYERWLKVPRKEVIVLRALALKGRATTTYPALQVLVDVPNEIAWNILSFWNVAVPWD